MIVKTAGNRDTCNAGATCGRPPCGTSAGGSGRFVKRPYGFYLGAVRNFTAGAGPRPYGSVGRQEKKSFSLCRHPVGSGSGIGSVTGAGDTTTGSAGAGAIGAIGSGGFVTRQALK